MEIIFIYLGTWSRVKAMYAINVGLYIIQVPILRLHCSLKHNHASTVVCLGWYTFLDGIP